LTKESWIFIERYAMIGILLIILGSILLYWLLKKMKKEKQKGVMIDGYSFTFRMRGILLGITLIGFGIYLILR